MNKHTLARWLWQSGAGEAVLALRRRAPRSWLTVLTYHRIAERKGDGTLDEVIDATPAQFERQVAFLAEHFHFVGTDEINACARGASLPDNPVLITFDDGYRDCCETALPILLRYQARATFFIATAYIGQGRLFWWDFIGRVLDSTRRDRIDLSYPRRLTLRLDACREQAEKRLLLLVKTHVGLDLDRFRAHLIEAADVAWSADEERRAAERMLMSWEQIRELARAGMDVQSHTRTHRVLQTLAPSELLSELGGAREELEARLGTAVTAVAYPVGYPLAHLDHVRTALNAAGYRWGFTNQSGANRWDARVDRYDLRRIAMSVDLDEDLFRAQASLPHLAPRRRMVFANN